MPIPVSIIIPVYNAADTIKETLDSVLAQTHPYWEIIIVDDESTDDSKQIAEHYVNNDSRIRLVSQPNSKVSVARNKGIALASNDWLVFLDPDDLIAPDYLELMTSEVEKDPESDLVHCAYEYINPEGEHLSPFYPPEREDYFPVTSYTCPFVIHGCLSRKSLVLEVGGFDPAFRTGEDWDLWQRMTRSGARCRSVHKILSFYRMRHNSLSRNIMVMYEDCLRVISQAFSEDKRVPNPLPKYRNGLPAQGVHRIRLHHSADIAASLIARGLNPDVVFEKIKNDIDPSIDPHSISDSLFYGIFMLTCGSHTSWFDKWGVSNNPFNNYLDKLEAHSGAAGLKKRTIRALERRLLYSRDITDPVKYIHTSAVAVEITKPITDIICRDEADLLHCQVYMEGVPAGRIELPVIDGKVTSEVLKDYITWKFSWIIMKRFLDKTVIPDLPDAEEWLDEETGEDYYDANSWKIFMQQLWAKPGWDVDSFYNSGIKEDGKPQKIRVDNTVTIEISDDLPELKLSGPEVFVRVMVGAVYLGTVRIHEKSGIVTAQALRVQIAMAANFELFRIVVREALIGFSLSEGKDLRERLRLSASLRQVNKTTMEALNEKTLIIARRNDMIGTSASRFAMLPLTAVHATEELVASGYDRLITPEHGILKSNNHNKAADPQFMPQSIMYSPDRITEDLDLSVDEIQWMSTEKVQDLSNRFVFETLFSKEPDPWKYTHPYETTKYEQTLSFLPEKVDNVLEIACAEGHFTAQLAPLVKNLIAADISQIALDRTAEKCNTFSNISYMQLDLVKDEIPPHQDLIFCSEVLYFMKGIRNLKNVAEKLANALNTGGHIIMANANQTIDEPDKPGFDWGLEFGAKKIGEVFHKTPGLQMVKELRTPLYRIQLFRKRKRWSLPLKREVRIMDQPTPIPPQVEDTVRWNGGTPSLPIYHETLSTSELPILMYHRVAPEGAANMQRYRVTPLQFEEQLRFLKESDYYTPEPEEWLRALITRKPLPGRAIILTFDDGYTDFYDYAAPLLFKYGFTAIVFIVTGHVGGTNIWDKVYGEELPLMNWKQIRELQANGILFGSHTVRHSPITGLSNHEVVEEGALSRAALQQQLNRPVKTIAYPYGEIDEATLHLLGACGYTIGFSCNHGFSNFDDNPLSLPRIEITGDDNIKEFIAKVTL